MKKKLIVSGRRGRWVFEFDLKNKCLSVPSEYGLIEYIGKTANAVMKDLKKKGFEYEWEDDIHLQMGDESVCGKAGYRTDDSKLVNCKLCLHEISQW